MQYTRYSSIKRDIVKDNINAIHKVQLPNRSEIRSQQMFATVNFNDVNSAEEEITVPYTGILYLTIQNAGDGDSVIINNPFLTGNGDVPIGIIEQPNGSSVTVTEIAPGKAELTTISSVSGLYVVRIGNQP